MVPIGVDVELANSFDTEITLVTLEHGVSGLSCAYRVLLALLRFLQKRQISHLYSLPGLYKVPLIFPIIKLFGKKIKWGKREGGRIKGGREEVGW